MCRAKLIATLVLLACFQTGNGPVALRSQEASPTRASVEEAYTLHRIGARYLPNAIQVHRKVISGGVPKGEEGLRELVSMGVKTVISVDGQKPDAKRAVKYGLRYVHLPHGYDGVPPDRAKELAKAVRELDGPIYVHCHHGKHRSPAAATVACVGAGLIPQTHAVTVLEFAGTSPRYRGLFESARDAKPLDEALLDQIQVEFRETVQVPPMADAMVDIEQTHDNLMEIASSGWQTPAKHPDLDAAHEALLLREHFTELLRTDYVREQSEAFRELVRDSEKAAKALELALRERQAGTPNAEPPDALAVLSARIAANCKACHEKFRDRSAEPEVIRYTQLENNHSDSRRGRKSSEADSNSRTGRKPTGIWALTCPRQTARIGRAEEI